MGVLSTSSTQSTKHKHLTTDDVTTDLRNMSDRDPKTSTSQNFQRGFLGFPLIDCTENSIAIATSLRPLTGPRLTGNSNQFDTVGGLVMHANR